MGKFITIILFVVSCFAEKSDAQDCELVRAALKKFTISKNYLMLPVADYVFDFYPASENRVIDSLTKYTALKRTTVDSIIQSNKRHHALMQLTNCKGVITITKQMAEIIMENNRQTKLEERLKKNKADYAFYEVAVPISLADYSYVEVTEVVKGMWTHTMGMLFKPQKGTWIFVKEVYSSAS